MLRYNFRHKLLFLILSSIIIISVITIPTESNQRKEVEEIKYNIILMIGDGMGFEHVKLARYVEVGKDQNLTLETLNYNYSVITLNHLSEITDSAAAGTAMATGVKTLNKHISMAPNGSVLKTILEISQDLGKATGVVTTTSIQHATPACFMSHVLLRTEFLEITRQIVEEANVDILLGGGLEYFTAQQLLDMQDNGYSYVSNKTELANISSGKVLGLFSDNHMNYELERDYTLTPSLREMTSKALEMLQHNSAGFFLMVEGGRIDHGGHDNNKTNVALEAIEFNLAVKEALNFVKTHENTILLVTADHETGGLAITNENLDGTFPTTGLTEEQNKTIRITRTCQIDVSWSTGYHTDKNVPFYGYGAPLENITINSIMENTEIFGIMNKILEFEQEDEEPITPPPETTPYINTTVPSNPIMTFTSPIIIITVPISILIIYIIRIKKKTANI
jgi:alkaline phosphatase